MAVTFRALLALALVSLLAVDPALTAPTLQKGGHPVPPADASDAGDVAVETGEEQLTEGDVINTQIVPEDPFYNPDQPPGTDGGEDIMPQTIPAVSESDETEEDSDEIIDGTGASASDEGLSIDADGDGAASNSTNTTDAIHSRHARAVCSGNGCKWANGLIPYQFDSRSFTIPSDPDAYSFCANEGGNCQCNTAIKYGAGNSYTYAWASGSTPCTDASFGDPYPWAQKSCRCLRNVWAECSGSSNCAGGHVKSSQSVSTFVCPSGTRITCQTKAARASELVQDAIGEYQRKTVLIFRGRRNTDTHYVTIRGASTGCSSHVGQGQPIITLGWCWNSYRSVLHEWGHSIGLWHEQQRFDRNAYINGADALGTNDPTNWGIQSVGSLAIEYDFESVMHYGLPGSVSRTWAGIQLWQKQGSPNTGSEPYISPLDAEGINAMYALSRLAPNRPATVTGSTTVGQNLRGQPSKERLYRFEVPCSGWFCLSTTQYRFSSCGSSFDTWLRILNSNFATVAQSDDGGFCGTQTVITVNLRGGVHYLMIEGFSNNEGSYTVSVAMSDPQLTVNPYPITVGSTRSGNTASANTNRWGNAAPDNAFRFTVPSSVWGRRYRFSTCGSGYDTYLRVYDDQWNEVAGCDDCGSCGVQTILDTNGLSGGSYWLVVDGFSSHKGSYSVTMTSLPTIPPFVIYNSPTSQPIGRIDGLTLP